MKKNFILLLMAAMLAVGCETDKPETAASLTIEPSELVLEAAGGAVQTVTVKAVNVEWDYSLTPGVEEWLTVSRDGETLSVSAKENLKGESRNAIITVKPTDNADVKERTVTVMQKASDNPVEYTMTLKPLRLDFVGEGAAAQEVTVTITGDFTWEAAAAADWITVTPGEDKFTVTVADNPDTKSREGEITVTPNDKSVKAETVLVVQEGKILPPEFEVDTEKIEFHFNSNMGSSSAKVTVDAVNVAWEAALEADKEGENTNWLRCTVQDDKKSVLISLLESNPLYEERRAWLVLTTDWAEKPEVRIPIVQAAYEDHLSTLTSDIDISSKTMTCTALTYPWDPSDNDESINPNVVNSDWEITMKETVDGTKYNKIKFTLTVQRIEENDANEYSIEEKVYSIVEPYAIGAKKQQGCIEAGSAAKSSRALYPGFYYLEYEDDGDEWNDNMQPTLNSAPMVEGTVEVKHNGGNNYTFIFDTKDDLGNVLKGTWTGDVEIKA